MSRKITVFSAAPEGSPEAAREEAHLRRIANDVADVFEAEVEREAQLERRAWAVLAVCAVALVLGWFAW